MVPSSRMNFLHLIKEGRESIILFLGQILAIGGKDYQEVFVIVSLPYFKTQRQSENLLYFEGNGIKR